MSNTTEAVDNLIITINNISTQVNRYITLFVFLFGTIGNLINILVLAQPIFRSNSCAIYFLASSVSALGILLVGLPSRIVAGWISTDPTNTNALLCKFRIFLLYSCRTSSVWLLVFATIDRYFSSSTKIHRRRLSSYRIACYSCLIICAIAFILWTETLLCYDSNVTNAPVKCYGKTEICRIFNDTVYASSTVMIPSVLMSVFGFLTIRNINRSNRAVQPFVILNPITNQNNKYKRKKIRRSEGSLTRMLILQVILLTFCSMPQAIHQFYLTFTVNINKTPLRLAIENFIVNFNFSLTYVGNGISFYLYTLNGTVFRQALLRIFQVYLCNK